MNTQLKPKPVIRCAVYTRKSCEEGLEQSFNSLDAQREACEAFILSQRHEGWRVVPAHYDDGGCSGGNMDRPALKQLLEDIAAQKIDTVVVYNHLVQKIGPVNAEECVFVVLVIGGKGVLV